MCVRKSAICPTVRILFEKEKKSTNDRTHQQPHNSKNVALRTRSTKFIVVYQIVWIAVVVFLSLFNFHHSKNGWIGCMHVVVAIAASSSSVLFFGHQTIYERVEKLARNIIKLYYIKFFFLFLIRVSEAKTKYFSIKPTRKKSNTATHAKKRNRWNRYTHTDCLHESFVRSFVREMRGEKVDICIFDAAKLNLSTCIIFLIRVSHSRTWKIIIKRIQAIQTPNCWKLPYTVFRAHTSHIHTQNASSRQIKVSKKERKTEVAKRTRKTYIHNWEKQRKKTWSKVCLTFITVLVAFFLYFRCVLAVP